VISEEHILQVWRVAKICDSRDTNSMFNKFVVFLCRMERLY